MARYLKHPVIWLQPWCIDCEHNQASEGRQWCEDDVWFEGCDCGVLPVKYVIAKDQPKNKYLDNRDSEDDR